MHLHRNEPRSPSACSLSLASYISGSKTTTSWRFLRKKRPATLGKLPPWGKMFVLRLGLARYRWLPKHCVTIDWRANLHKYGTRSDGKCICGLAVSNCRPSRSVCTIDEVFFSENLNNGRGVGLTMQRWWANGMERWDLMWSVWQAILGCDDTTAVTDSRIERYVR